VAERLVDTHLAFYRILRWHNKGWWIPTKHFKENLFWRYKGWWIPTKDFIECLCGRKAGGYPLSILKNVFVDERLVDTHQAF
jgi:hypothetical protein